MGSALGAIVEGEGGGPVIVVGRTEVVVVGDGSVVVSFINVVVG